jgi:SAM-dependent methyltransferase
MLHKVKNEKFIKVDIGCGSNKKPDCIGIDCQDLVGVDFVLDLTKDKLPFEDNSVDYIFSSHFLEHIKNPNYLFSEISRVAIEGAIFENWTPYAHSDDAFCYGHETFFAEEHWQHICVKYPEFWRSIINARWLLKEVVYIVDKNVFDDIISNGFKIEFAINYFKGVVREFAVFVEIRHSFNVENILPKKYYSFNRSGERFSLKI